MAQDDHTPEIEDGAATPADPVTESAESLETPAEASAPSDTTIGMRLQAIREYKKLSLEDIAAETQISKEKLEHIEKMDVDGPSVFLRGAVKTYAQLLGLPADTYAKEYIEAIEGKTHPIEKKTVISDEPAAPIPAMQRYAKPKQKSSVQVTYPMLGGALAAVCAVGLIIWGLTGTKPPAPTVSQSVLAINTPKNGGDQSLLSEVGLTEVATAETVNLSITALRSAWIEVRGADGTIFRSRKMAAGETYHPRISSGWTVTARDGSAFEWRVEDVSIGTLSEDPVEVFAVSVDRAAQQAAEILAPPIVAGTNETQSVR